MQNKSFNLRVAILVDLDFFLKRYKCIFKFPVLEPQKTAKSLFYMAHKHVGDDYLYRIFCYDCLPYENRSQNPISKHSVEFSKTDVYKFRIELHNQLKKLRKIALRMGYLKKESPDFNWILKKDKLKNLLNKKIKIEDMNLYGLTPVVSFRSSFACPTSS